ncbi:MAG: hypothetical protein NZ920_03320 [Aigarchaeota archaeon]|nr:hypothetical protein [Aigarchaeota archaeon]MDW8092351.1 hypothetical protein [Nitrososphaerota archaeon]
MRTTFITTTAVLATIAIVLGVLPFSFPFPIVPYLRFDLGEIPVFMAFYALGPLASFIAATAYFLVLLVFGSFTPIGPLMKYAALLSTLAGAWVGAMLARNRGMVTFMALGGVVGGVLRIAVMTVVNYIVIVILFPEFLGFAIASVQATTSLAIPTQLTGLILVLIFTAIYNALHTILSLVPAAYIIEAVSRRVELMPTDRSWMRTIVRTMRK